MVIKLLDHFKNALITSSEIYTNETCDQIHKRLLQSTSHWILRSVENYRQQNNRLSPKKYGIVSAFIESLTNPNHMTDYFFILKRLNYFLQKYLLEIKYWQILQLAD